MPIVVEWKPYLVGPGQRGLDMGFLTQKSLAFLPFEPLTAMLDYFSTQNTLVGH
jgi:hypothetical protein